ncbi:MAG: helix-turn-helix domain-containing protein [Candidatus Binatia bacterium]
MPKTKIAHGGRNVFADLGFADARERQAKTRLALELNKILKSRKLRQVDAAKLLGVPQPKISALANYRLDGFSVERLMDFLTSLDRDIEIVIRPRSARAGAGQISVVAMR